MTTDNNYGNYRQHRNSNGKSGFFEQEQEELDKNVSNEIRQ